MVNRSTFNVLSNLVKFDRTAVLFTLKYLLVFHSLALYVVWNPNIITSNISMTWDGKLQKNRKFLSVLLHQEILKLFLTQKPANTVTINFLLFAWKQTKKTGFTEVWNCCKKQNSLVRVLAVIGIGFSLYLQDKNIFRNKKFQLYLYFFIESISGFISSTVFFLSCLLNVSFYDLFEVVQESQKCISW